MRKEKTICERSAHSVRLGLWGGASLAALTMAWATSAGAVSGNLGEVQLQVDPVVTVGASLRSSPRSCLNVGVPNGGCVGPDGYTRSINSDNGNLNFDRWDFVSANVKAIVDISASWQDFGVFVRPRAFYDQVYTTNNLHFLDLPHDAQQRLNSKIEILDAYAYWNGEFLDQPFTLRVGKQVQNWGESLFISGGINQFGTNDVSALRQAGSEVREALQPIPMVYGSIAATSSLTLEGFWQFGYANTELDPTGSFFSIDDSIGPGAAVIPVQLGPVDQPYNPVGPAFYQIDDRNEGNVLSQFGLAAKYYATWLNQGTDLGFYYVHYNARVLNFQYLVDDVNNVRFRYNYPGAIDLFGVSFNTQYAGSAVAGELSYQPSAPMAVNSADQIGQLPPFAAALPTTLNQISYAPGNETTAYLDGDIWQGQFNTITQFNTSHPITRLIGSDVTTFITNPGFTWAPNAGDGDPINRGGSERGTAVVGTEYADSFSWGYVLSLSANYNNFLNTPWTVSPSIAWRHDVMGYAPGNLYNGWMSNTKRLTLGVEADLQNLWKVNLSYTDNMGNPSRNQNLDRDFIAFSVSRAF